MGGALYAGCKITVRGEPGSGPVWTLFLLRHRKWRTAYAPLQSLPRYLTPLCVGGVALFTLPCTEYSVLRLVPPNNNNLNLKIIA
jgi:hypothetical protein